MTILKTILQQAKDTGKTQQNIRQSKTKPPVECPIYAMYNGEYIHIGYQKFIVIENNCIDNEQVTTNT